MVLFILILENPKKMATRQRSVAPVKRAVPTVLTEGRIPCTVVDCKQSFARAGEWLHFVTIFASQPRSNCQSKQLQLQELHLFFFNSSAFCKTTSSYRTFFPGLSIPHCSKESSKLPLFKVNVPSPQLDSNSLFPSVYSAALHSRGWHPRNPP